MLKIIRNTSLMSVALLIMPFASVSAADPVKLDDRSSRISYSLGYQIGGDFKSMDIELDAQAVIKGIEDAMSGTEPLMPHKAMHGVLLELKRKSVDSERKKRSQAGREEELRYLAEGKKFMEENASKPGVETATSGLQYRIIEPGTGKSPHATDRVTVNYRGTLTNGNEFDSSYKRGAPSSFLLNGVIKGWTEGLQLIKEGGKIQLVIPPELAYGSRGPLGHRTLIFDVELVSVADKEHATESQDAQAQGKQ